MPLADRNRAYWRRNLRVTSLLLSVWFAVTFVVGFFADELAEYTFLGFPLGFYMGAQGAPLVYLVIIGCYARYMNRLDREHAVHESPPAEEEAASEDSLASRSRRPELHNL